MKPLRLAAIALTALLAAPAAVADTVRFDTTGGNTLTAHWFPVDAAGPRAAIIALHGCGGLYRRDGKTLDERYPEYVEHLHAAGYHVLLPDSFGSRGSGPICGVKNGERTITAETRREDIIAAVRWLAARADVAPGRIALLGWSHGATSALIAMNGAREPHAGPLAGAVVFYPGCRAPLARPYRLDVPLLMLLGEQDDWTPPAHCVRLAQRTREARPDADLTVIVYPHSYHGFDGARPVRFRTGVPNGVDPAGVHAGGNPAARAQARRQMDEFFARILK